MTSDAAKRCIAELGRKYLWWDPVGDDPHSENRIIAQAMNLGTFDDIVVLEQTVGKSRLVEYQLSLLATHPRRYGGLVPATQVFDSTRVLRRGCLAQSQER